MILTLTYVMKNTLLNKFQKILAVTRAVSRNFVKKLLTKSFINTIYGSIGKVALMTSITTYIVKVTFLSDFQNLQLACIRKIINKTFVIINSC